MKKHYLTNKQKERLYVIIKCIIAVIFMSPIFVGLVFSFIPDEELYSLPSWSTIFRTLTINNYIQVFKQLPLLSYIKTSLVMCLIVIVVQITIASLAAYALSFFKFRGRDFIFTLVLIAMMIPGQVVTITNFLTVRKLQLLNTYLGLTIISFAGGRSLFMFRQSYLTLPNEMHEAAIVDGCGDLRYLFMFAIPLSLPSIASVSILLFIGEFNAYLWPLLISRSPNMYTIQIGMEQMINAEGTPTYGKMMAVAMVSLVIPVIAFFVGEDYLISGMTSGSVKG